MAKPNGKSRRRNFELATSDITTVDNISYDAPSLSEYRGFQEQALSICSSVTLGGGFTFMTQGVEGDYVLYVFIL
jgi:hypothetical protein